MDVPVSQLRAELASWIERARDGEDVVITDRGEPVARLTPVTELDRVVAEMVAAGLATRPTNRGPRRMSSDFEPIVPTPGPPIADYRHRMPEDDA